MGHPSAGNQPPTNLPSATNNPGQSMLDKVESVKSSIVTILSVTAWPAQANNIAQELLRVIENAPSLKNIPKDDACIQAEHRDLLVEFLRRSEIVLDMLKRASDRYREKQGEAGGGIKRLFASLKPNKCREMLDSCRAEMKKALALLPDSWTHGPTAAKATTPTELPVQERDLITADDRAKAKPDDPDWLRAVRVTFNAVETISGTIPIIGSYVGAAANVGAKIVEMVQNMRSNEEATKDFCIYASRLSEILNNFEGRSVEKRRDDLTRYITELQRQLQLVQRQIEELNSSGTLTKAFFSDEHGKTLKGYQDAIRVALEQMQLLVSLNTTNMLTELYDKEALKEQQRLLNLLGDASYGARGDSIEEVVCLPGTRVQVLERINTWIRTTRTSERVLWIRGMAGRGKSTVASTIAHQWKYQAATAIFHFRRGQRVLDHRLICALARQLGRSSLVPRVKEAILQSIQENEDIAQERLKEQFLKLLAGPLSSHDSSRPILLIVDALDECEDLEYAVNFVKLIDEYLTPSKVKFLLTSRPEAALLRALEPRQWSTEDLDLLQHTNDDVAQFFQHGFSRVRKEYNLGEDWPQLEEVETLLNMSQGLFQWAHTVIQYLMEGSPQLRLQELLASPSICDGLDELYLQILSKAYRKAKKSPAREGLFICMLGLLVVAPHPVSLDIFAFLYADHAICRNQTQENVVQLLRLEVFADLRSLIHVPNSSTDPIQLVHTSVRDLLVDKERCRGEPYSVDPTRNHHDLALKCLHLMGKDLKFNICNLSDLSKPNSDLDIQQLVQLHVPRGLQYCCRSWSFHLTTGAAEPTLGVEGIITGDFKRFGEERILGWLEVMSLIGVTREAIAIAKHVNVWLQGFGSIINGSFAALWNDVHRLATSYHEPISFGALHIYASALPFCPTKTALWKTYSKYAMTRVLNSPQDSTWTSSLWAKLAFVPVAAVAFSPDGKVLASTGHGMTKRSWHPMAEGIDLCAIRLWDTETGAPIGQPLRGHTQRVDAIAFSPNGMMLISASRSDTICRWDLKTRSQIGEPMKSQDSAVNTVAFSPNGERIASGAADGTIQLWNAETGAPIGQPIKGHADSVNTVAFSSNGKFLASGSRDNTIRLWDAKTGTPIGEPLEGHKDSITSVAFSPNGRLLASGSLDRTIRLWDADTWAPIKAPLSGHAGQVNAVAFSPDSKFIASGSGDSTIRLWDAETGAFIGEPPDGHYLPVNCVAFSPRNKLLASGSEDMMIRLWDAEVGALIGIPLEGGGDPALADPLLAQSNSFSAALGDNAVPSWYPPSSWNVDAETGVPVGKVPNGNGGSFTTVAFSPNGELLASGSRNKTIHLWDARTGVLLGEALEGHDDFIASVAFSPDGKLLASGSDDRTVRIWETETGAQIRGPLRGHDGPVNTVAFSLNGKILASGSGDKTIQLWDTENGAPIGEPMKAHDGPVLTIDFSQDGRFLASGSADGTIRLWDAETAALLGQLIEDRTRTVQNIVFLSNGQLIVHYNHNFTRLLDPPQLPITDGGATTGRYTIKSLFSSSQSIPLGTQGQWLTFRSKRVFWLPAKYWNAAITLAHVSHGVLVFAMGQRLIIADVSRALNL